MRNRPRIAAATAVVLLAALTACGRPHSQQPTAQPPSDYPATLRQLVSTEAMFGHLQRLQQIADTNAGNRAVGTPGYEASVDYIADTLRHKGFDVQTPEFTFRHFHSDAPSLTVGGATVSASALQYTIGTGPQGVGGPLVPAPADDTPGCSASDYDGLPVAGAVALVQRGTCEFSVKVKTAADRGAVAVIIADNVDEEQMGGTLGEKNDATIPAISISKADGSRLRAAPAPTRITLKASTTTVKARNVVAQTRTGSSHDVVVVGAHLDSVPAGPGIDDNGSGVAAVLETAVQMGSAPPIKNAVRFGFWGAEEIGLVGSDKYVETLNLDALKDIALYLNFDMLASPNPGYFVYAGNQSGRDNQKQPAPRLPDGSEAIWRALVAYLASAGKTAENSSLGGRSDYQSFTEAGIPAGGLFTGAEEKKSPEQARRWGGQAGQPFDPNYHQKTDTLGHIDRAALDVNGHGVAYAVAQFAQDSVGGNGIPARDNRTRQVVPNR